jgi:hypothetical protein
MVFKKHISLLLAFFLLVSNSGLAFNVHFCGEKIAAISSVFSNEEVCVMPVKAEKSCCAKEKETKKCCSDKKVNLESKAEKSIIKSVTFDFYSVFITNDWKPIVFSETLSICCPQNKDYYCDSHSPPLYDLYCQFTLYA